TWHIHSFGWREKKCFEATFTFQCFVSSFCLGNLMANKVLLSELPSKENIKFHDKIRAQDVCHLLISSHIMNLVKAAFVTIPEAERSVRSVVILASNHGHALEYGCLLGVVVKAMTFFTYPLHDYNPRLQKVELPQLCELNNFEIMNNSKRLNGAVYATHLTAKVKKLPGQPIAGGAIYAVPLYYKNN
ncbi:hypothetical protein C0J52_24390, partial [Blattella germanica]